jgi:hypothetical protein
VCNKCAGGKGGKEEALIITSNTLFFVYEQPPCDSLMTSLPHVLPTTTLTEMLRSGVITAPSCIAALPRHRDSSQQRDGGLEMTGKDLFTVHAGDVQKADCVGPLRCATRKRTREGEGCSAADLVDNQLEANDSASQEPSIAANAAASAADSIVAVAVLPSIKAVIAAVNGLAKGGSVISVQFICERWGGDGGADAATVCAVEMHKSGDRKEKMATTEASLPSCPVDVDAEDVEDDPGDDVDAQQHDDVHDVDQEHCQAGMSSFMCRPTAAVSVRTSRILFSTASTTSIRHFPHSAEFTCAAVHYEEGFHSFDCPDDCDDGKSEPIHDTDNVIQWAEWIAHHPNDENASPRRRIRPQCAALFAVQKNGCGCGILQFATGLCIPRRVLLCNRHWTAAWKQCFTVATLTASDALEKTSPSMRELHAHAVRGGGGGVPTARHACLAKTIITAQRLDTAANAPYDCTHQYGLCCVHADVSETLVTGWRRARVDDHWCRVERRGAMDCQSYRQTVEVFVSSTLLLEVLSRLDAVERSEGCAAAALLPLRCYVTATSLVLDITPQSRPATGSGSSFGFLRHAEFRLPRLSLSGEHVYRTMQGGLLTDADEVIQFSEVEADCSHTIEKCSSTALECYKGPILRGCSKWMSSSLTDDGRTKPEELCIVPARISEGSKFTFRVDLGDTLSLLNVLSTAMQMSSSCSPQKDVSMCVDVSLNGLLSLVCHVQGVLSHRIQLLDWGPMVLDRHHGDVRLFKAFEEDALRRPDAHAIQVPEASWGYNDDFIPALCDFLSPFRSLTAGGGVEVFFTVVPHCDEIYWTVRLPSVGLSATTQFSITTLDG